MLSEKSILNLCVLSMVLVNAFLVYSFYDLRKEFTSKPGYKVYSAANNYGIVGCNSNSMGLTIRCNDKTFGRSINSSERLELGRIYVYKKDENTSVVHRLVYCDDASCQQPVFKGDNNLYAEKINRSQIIYVVDYTAYDGGVFYENKY